MKKKIFRVSMDVLAKNQVDAMDKVDAILDAGISKLSCRFRYQENPLNDEEEATVLEVCRVALGDAEVYEMVADSLDLSDEAMKKVQEKVIEITETVGYGKTGKHENDENDENN